MHRVWPWLCLLPQKDRLQRGGQGELAQGELAGASERGEGELGDEKDGTQTGDPTYPWGAGSLGSCHLHRHSQSMEGVSGGAALVSGM